MRHKLFMCVKHPPHKLNSATNTNTNKQTLINRKHTRCSSQKLCLANWLEIFDRTLESMQRFFGTPSHCICVWVGEGGVPVCVCVCLPAKSESSQNLIGFVLTQWTANEKCFIWLFHWQRLQGPKKWALLFPLSAFKPKCKRLQVCDAEVTT